MKQLFSLLSVLLLTTTLQAQQLAFPGAEGYGAYATGGRGGKVVHVTNLNAEGPGSLADAVSQSNRFVVFDVGGVIDITGKNLFISSNITIAGQTAPGEGITIYGGRVIATDEKNIIMRYIRMRGGKSVNSSKCTLTLDNCQNFIMDHCTVTWGPWDNVHIKDAYNVTWQYCINAEGIEPQRFGAITDGTLNWTIHHCLWANNKSRNPKMKCSVQYYNNVIYNYAMGIIGGHSAGNNYQDVMNNYFIAGPEGSYKYFDQWTETDHLYSTGNYYDGNCDGQLNGTLITDYNGATPMSKPNFNTTHPLNLESAAKAYATVVEEVGASRVRDIHDKRLIEQLTSLGTKGSFIANEDDLGGIGTVAGGARPTDTDNDGMPDEWEVANGLNPDANDANAYTLGGGYTNIEHYVNSLAKRGDYLMSPMNLKAKLTDDTSVELTWELEANEIAKAVVVEQSEDGRTFAEVQRLAADATQTTITGLTASQIYFFRLKVVGEDDIESFYSTVVSVNDEYMRAGGGMPAGTDPFVPVEGKLYRIINYATLPYNASTTLEGTPKYMTFNADGTLGSTETFHWDDPALLWAITPVEGGLNIQNYANKKYIAAAIASINGTSRIGTSDEPTLLAINYASDQEVAQSGLSENISMFRINSPTNNNRQIRARAFADDWLWGLGTTDRADMLFTFVEIDASLVKIFLTNLRTTLEDAIAILSEAKADVTLGYPSQHINALKEAVSNAQNLVENIDDETTQAEIDAQTANLNKLIEELQAARIYTLAGFSTEKAYNIYSYGTHSGARDADANTSIQRRYLYSIKTSDAKRDSLVYRIGLSDNDINNGKQDAIAKAKAALWGLEAGENGYVYVRNLTNGAYLQIENLLSAQPVAIHPTYAKQDNSKMAFYMDANEAGNRLFNVGAPDSDGKGGPLEFFTVHADRTRLRWVFEQTNVNVAYPTAIEAVMGEPLNVRYFSLEGIELNHRPSKGIYIEQITTADGRERSRKVIGR